MIPGSGRSPREGHGNPVQYSCLENPRDGEAWWAAVYGVAHTPCVGRQSPNHWTAREAPVDTGGFFTTITTCDALAPMAVTQTKRLTLAWGDPRPYRTGTNPHILGVRPQMAPVYRGWVIMPTSLGIKEGMPGTHTCISALPSCKAIVLHGVKGAPAGVAGDRSSALMAAPSSLPSAHASMGEKALSFIQEASLPPAALKSPAPPALS